jgi:hypothetical protein
VVGAWGLGLDMRKEGGRRDEFSQEGRQEGIQEGKIKEERLGNLEWRQEWKRGRRG